MKLTEECIDISRNFITTLPLKGGFISSVNGNLCPGKAAQGIRPGTFSDSETEMRSILSQVRVGSALSTARLCVSTTHLPDLRGHFPGRPILPAVVMLDAMFELANHMHPGPIDRVHEAKFRRLVTPKDGHVEVEVKKQRTIEKERVTFLGTIKSRSKLAAEALFSCSSRT